MPSDDNLESNRLTNSRLINFCVFRTIIFPINTMKMEWIIYGISYQFAIEETFYLTRYLK